MKIKENRLEENKGKQTGRKLRKTDWKKIKENRL